MENETFYKMVSSKIELQNTPIYIYIYSKQSILEILF